MNLLSVPDMLNDSIGSFHIFIDKHCVITEAKNNCSAILPSQIFVVGNSVLDYFSTPNQQKFLATLSTCGDGKQEFQTVVIPIQAGNKSVGIRWNMQALVNHNNTSVFELLGTPSGEVNETVKRTDSTNHSSLFDFHSKPFVSFNLEGEIVHANSQFGNLLHYTKEELVDKPLLSLAASSDDEELQANISKACAGLPLQFSCSLLNKKGDPEHLSFTTTPLIENSLFVGVNAFVRKLAVTSIAKGEIQKDEKRLNLILGRLKKILNSSLDMICAIDENGKFTYVSAACKEILGFKTRELIGKIFIDFVHHDDIERSKVATKNLKKGIRTTNFETRFYRKDGSIAQLIWSSRWEENDKRYYCIARDATEKKLSDANLRASEEKYRVLFYNHSVPGWIYDSDTLQFLEVNDAATEHYGYTRQEFLNLNFKDIIAEEEHNSFDVYRKQENFFTNKHKGLWRHRKKNGQLFYAEISSSGINFQDRRARLVLSIDRTEQTIAEQELRKSNERFIFLSHATFDAIWDWNLQTNEVTWNDGVLKMFDLSDPDEPTKIEWRYANLHVEDKERVIAKIDDHIKNNVAHWDDEYRMKAGNGYKYIFDRGYIIYNDENKPVRMIGAMLDLTERKSHENMLQNLNSSLEKRALELAESNGELERFAYVASHDLQEPLRMVTSFLQLLEKRYKDKLDKKANEYINYAVDGAERMKRLILDLLEYSRVNSNKAEVEEVDLNDIIKDLTLTYKSFLQETRGSINFSNLPSVKGNKTQILQLFQNIIGNALKYRSNVVPEIDISFEEENSFFKFAISDNGIGINPKFFHKIFIIFQRLHNRDEYSGTGIGLAICKKIIDKHGGQISVESTPGQGSTFYFTLPKFKTRLL